MAAFLRQRFAVPGTAALSTLVFRKTAASTNSAPPPRPEGGEPGAFAGPRPGGSEGAGSRRLRVLVTGFHDWRDLGGEASPNLWRCRDNPSCRLILGAPSHCPPVRRSGPLVAILREEARHLGCDLHFQTLPVLWGTSQSLDLPSFDAVIHIGLGVYDSRRKLLVEDGAFNGRAGKDAAAHEPGATIEFAAPQALHHERMSAAVAAVDGRQSGVYAVRAARARPGNSYICNETHWRALRALDDQSLAAAFFIHVPVPDKTEFATPREQEAYDKFCDLSSNTDYVPLAHAVADVIVRLLEASLPLA